MLPDQPLLIKCPYRQALISIDELEKAGEVEAFSDTGTRKDTKSYNVPELQDHLAALYGTLLLATLCI